ncbi:hypothetical protein C1H46_007097 [Malus baccata]|uniref:Hexosyltransferase n=1 Tax=Malus baccata TaxID=106549 RepID=A0A540N8A7_MALBA|nr:hypothetical protein C1H46_007097 [Malus baccata]
MLRNVTGANYIVLQIGHLYSIFLGDIFGLISTSIRSALNCSLNYARPYLTELLPLCVRRVVYLDSGLILVDDIAKLSTTLLLAAPEYYNANFTSYFTSAFWSNPSLSLTFVDRHACYFNTGVLLYYVSEVQQKKNGRSF